MLKILFLIPVLIIAPFVVAKKIEGELVDRSLARQTILKGCMETLTVVPDKRQKICQCIVENFDKKANDYELQMLAENYKDMSGADSQQDTLGSALQTFDYDVATACISNHNWRISSK